MLIYRELDQLEYNKIPEEALGGYKLPESNSRVIAAIDGDKIIAIWCAMGIVHLEPLWIAPTYRKSSFILKRMWEAVKQIFSEDIPQAIVIAAGDMRITTKIAKWCGGTEIPGKVFVLPLKEIV